MLPRASGKGRLRPDTIGALERDPNPEPVPQHQALHLTGSDSTIPTPSAPTPATATQSPISAEPPPQELPPRSGRVPGFGGATPFVVNRFFAVPRPGETRFVQNEVVLQISSNTPPELLQSVVARLGFSILEIQNLGGLGTHSVRISTKGVPVAKAIGLLARQKVIAAATANYVYALTEDAAARRGENAAGDAGQYVVEKLRLADIHRVVRGTDIPIAVIDSEIDANHPDLEGVYCGPF